MVTLDLFVSASLKTQGGVHRYTDTTVPTTAENFGNTGIRRKAEKNRFKNPIVIGWCGRYIYLRATTIVYRFGNYLIKNKLHIWGWNGFDGA